MIVQVVVGPDGLLISSTVDNTPTGPPAPDDLVKGILLQAWETMLAKTIRDAIAAEQRVRLAGADALPPNGRIIT